MTREQAIDAFAKVMFDQAARYWPEERDRAEKMINALIAIGVFVPSDPKPFPGGDILIPGLYGDMSGR